MGQVKRWNSGEQLTDQKKDRIFSVTVEAQKIHIWIKNFMHV